MRGLLNALYRASGALAAVCLAGICAIVLLQVGANLVDEVVGWLTGEPIGLVIPSYAEFAGFFLVAASFLALAYTLRSGDHIRVSLIIQHITGDRRRWIELWCIGVGASITGYFAFFSVRLVLESLRFGDVSPGMVPVPLWLPQTAMAMGLVILAITFVDEFVSLLKGNRPSYRAAEESTHPSTPSQQTSTDSS